MARQYFKTNLHDILCCRFNRETQVLHMVTVFEQQLVALRHCAACEQGDDKTTEIERSKGTHVAWKRESLDAY